MAVVPPRHVLRGPYLGRVVNTPGQIADFDADTGRFTFVRPATRVVYDQPWPVLHLGEELVQAIDDATDEAWAWVVPDRRARARAVRRCPHCRAGAPHHQLSRGSIGGPREYTVWDIHEISDASGVGLSECLAAHLFDPRLLP